jgi:hypothetical protein
MEWLSAVDERKARIAKVNAKRDGRSLYAVDKWGNVGKGQAGRSSDPNKLKVKTLATNESTKPAETAITPAEQPKTEYDFDALGEAHRHFITNTRFVGQDYKAGFESFMSELESKLNEFTPDDRQAEIPKILEDSKRRYFQLLNSIKSTAEGAYSMMMAGGSKFNTKQSARRGAAYDRSLSNFVNGKRAIESEALRITGAQSVIDRKKQQELIEKQQNQKKADKTLKEIQAKFKKTPIINDPSYKAPKHITKAEWGEIPSDYKAVAIDPETGIRYRAHMTTPVYITDQKNTPISVAEDAITKLFDEMKEAGIKNPSRFIPAF